jgi:hypothetical protein
MVDETRIDIENYGGGEQKYWRKRKKKTYKCPKNRVCDSEKSKDQGQECKFFLYKKAKKETIQPPSLKCLPLNIKIR